MSRIVLTSTGRNLQKEILKEIGDDTYTIKQRDTANSNSLADTSLASKDQTKIQNHKRTSNWLFKQTTINEQIRRNLEHLDDEDPSTHNAFSIDYSNNKFLQAKIAKLNNQLNKDNPYRKKSEFLCLPPISGNGQSISPRGSSPMDISANYSVRGSADLSDQFVMDQQHKVLHYESSITRLMEKHLLNEKQILKTANQVLKNYDRRLQIISDQNHKPPELLESLREKNPEAVEVLLRNTNSNFRKQKRLSNYAKKKFQPYQNRFSDLTTKRFKTHLDTIREH